MDGALAAVSGSLTVGGLSVLLAYANQYMKPFNDISSVVTELQNALACASRVFALRNRRDGKPVPYGYHPAASSIFSIKIPYPRVGSFTRTCVTAPTSLPFWITGEPLTGDCH